MQEIKGRLAWRSPWKDTDSLAPTPGCGKGEDEGFKENDKEREKETEKENQKGEVEEER